MYSLDSNNIKDQFVASFKMFKSTLSTFRNLTIAVGATTKYFFLLGANEFCHKLYDLKYRNDEEAKEEANALADKKLSDRYDRISQKAAMRVSNQKVITFQR